MNKLNNIKKTYKGNGSRKKERKKKNERKKERMNERKQKKEGNEVAEERLGKKMEVPTLNK